jgi:serine/threonine-protein kinase
MILLEKDPANRFPSAAAFGEALETRRVPAHRSAAVSRASRSSAGMQGLRRQDVQESESASEDQERWDHPDVIAFRRKVGPWAFWGGVSILLSIFGVIDIVGLWGLYTIYIAWKYAKLWTNGHDWRDVLKEPHDRMFFDVVAEWADGVRALWDPNKRTEVRERQRLRGSRGSLIERQGAPGSPPRLSNPSALSGRHGDVVRGAGRNRDDILRLLESLPKRDRELLSDVPSSANELYRRVEGLASSLGEIERGLPEESPEELDGEISRLEAEANPLDFERSEQRVRRLAQLKRQRRAVAGLSGKLTGQRERMESCALALENMRLDILRLRAGAQTFEHITSVAEKAVALAKEVDTAMYVKDEMSKLGRRSAGSART